MAVSDELVVWLDHDPVAVLERVRRGHRARLSLRYLEPAFNRFALNAPVLSVSLPLREEPFAHGLTRNFFDNVLPEGSARTIVARKFGLASTDTFGLLNALGRESVGALVVRLPDAGPPPRPEDPTVAPAVADAQLTRLIAELPVNPLGIGDSLRLSLPGVQGKLVLTRRGDGRWGLPGGGVASTHVLKPPIDESRTPRSVGNELFSMRVARHAGVTVAGVECIQVDGTDVLVVERFDRVLDGGIIRRIHQEDSCQALGVRPDSKYERDGGPKLRQIAGILADYGHPDDLRCLLRLMVFNLVVGNADAHGKNISLLHDEATGISLAPAYDILSTVRYPQFDQELAMRVGGARRLDHAHRKAVLAEAVSWGISRDEATAVAGELLRTLPRAVEQAGDELGPHADPAVAPLIARYREGLLRPSTAPVASSEIADLLHPPDSPWTGVPTTERALASPTPAPPPPSRAWVHPYRRKDGTPVRGHWRAPHRRRP